MRLQINIEFDGGSNLPPFDARAQALNVATALLGPLTDIFLGGSSAVIDRYTPINRNPGSVPFVRIGTVNLMPDTQYLMIDESTPR